MFEYVWICLDMSVSLWSGLPTLNLVFRQTWISTYFVVHSYFIWFWLSISLAKVIAFQICCHMASNKYKLFVSLAWGRSYIKGKGNSKECTVRWCIGLKTIQKIESINKAFLFWYWQRPKKYFFRNKTFLLSLY